jgi:integral membrane protein
MGMTSREPDLVVPWFYALGRAETASFVALLGIAMPLKYAAGMPGATAWVGWLHGMLLLVYVIALLSVVRVHGLGLRHALVGGVLALVPFGPVVLEWRWRKTGVLPRGAAAEA